MKKILVFRSAKHPLMEECIKKINEQYENSIIWLCVQEECINRYSKYSNVRFVVFPNGMFNYEKTIADKLLRDTLVTENFDEVYIPYSSAIPSCEEIEKIVVRIIGKRKAVYYNRDGNVERKRIHIGSIKFKKIIETLRESIEHTVMRMIYVYFARKGVRKSDRG